MTDQSSLPVVVPHSPPPPPDGWDYASFSTRALAFSIDQFIVFVIVVVLALPLAIFFGIVQLFAWPFAVLIMTPPGQGLHMLVSWFYFAMQESSRHQATFGKRWCGLRVTDGNGHRITLPRATGRFFGKYLSAFIMLVGFIMAAFTERHQALHDLLADTLVLKRKKT